MDQTFEGKGPSRPKWRNDVAFRRADTPSLFGSKVDQAQLTAIVQSPDAVKGQTQLPGPALRGPSPPGRASTFAFQLERR